MFANIIANEKKMRRERANQVREETREEERALREQAIEQERKLREQEVEQERKLREQEVIETARILLEMGDSLEKVALATKLTIERVEEIKAGTAARPS